MKKQKSTMRKLIVATLMLAFISALCLPMHASVSEAGYDAETWNSNGMLYFGDGVPDLDRNVTCDEFFSTIDLTLNFPENCANYFYGYSMRSPGYNAVSYAYEQGWLSEMYPDNTFPEDEDIMLQEIITVLGQYFEFSGCEYIGCEDEALIADYAKKYFSSALDLGFISINNGCLEPTKTVTYRELTGILSRVFSHFGCMPEYNDNPKDEPAAIPEPSIEPDPVKEPDKDSAESPDQEPVSSPEPTPQPVLPEATEPVVVLEPGIILNNGDEILLSGPERKTISISNINEYDSVEVKAEGGPVTLMASGANAYIVTQNGMEATEATINVTAQKDGFADGMVSIEVRNLFDGGKGTEKDPYLISGAEQFDAIRKYSGYSFRLTKDIDISKLGSWVPVGSQSAPFSGTIDGAGKTVSGLTINMASSSYVGLIGYLSNVGYIKNLKVKTSASGVAAGSYAGIVAGYSKGDISGCTAEGSIRLTGDSPIGGGIVGYAEKVIKGCSSSAAVVTDSPGAKIGGIAGFAAGGASGCAFTGSVTANGKYNSSTNVPAGSYAGGIAAAGYSLISDCTVGGSVYCSLYGGGVVGYLNGTMDNCRFSGSVTTFGNTSYTGGVVAKLKGIVKNSSSSGKVLNKECDSRVGGVVAYVPAGSEVSRCYSTGSTVCEGSLKSYVGGVVGDIEGGLVKECYSTGTVGAKSMSYVGGVAGILHGGKLTACYSTINVKVTSGSIAYVGGVAGYINDGIVENSYSTGDVATCDSGYAGGVVGTLKTDNSYLRNCYATGKVTSANNDYTIGGAVGGALGGTVDHCVAANSVVSGKNPSRFGKISGKSVFENNYAYSGMLVNGVTLLGTQLKLGTDATLAKVTSKALYTTLGWKFGSTTESPWVFNEKSDYKLPVLYWQSDDTIKSVRTLVSLF